MHTLSRAQALRLFCFTTIFLLLALLRPGFTAEGGPSEHMDIEIGGPGTEAGKFVELRDITFDNENRLYALDGGEVDAAGNRKGNFRVQRFDGRGKFQVQFSVWDEGLGKSNEPSRIAVDSRGQVYVSQPKAGLVQQFSAAGTLLKKIEVPFAKALAIRKIGDGEQVLAMGAQYYRNKWQPIEKLHVLGVDGSTSPAIALSKPVSNCVDMVVEKDGNVLLLADINQIYRFDVAGKLISVLGGGTFKRTESGSELRHTLALDSAGNIYAHAFGKIARFDPAWSTVGTRAAEYYWYDPWSPHDSYVAYAIDNTDRFWIATTGKADGTGRYHLRPCISRVKTNYFEKLKVATTKQLGLDAVVSVELPYNIAYDFSPIPIQFEVKPGYRRVKDVTVKWHVYDMLKSPGASGKFDLKLEDGIGGTNRVQFTPSAWGWYTAEFQIFERDELLMGVTTHIGVTPKFPGMPTLAAGESPGGWRDIPRLAFCGLKSHRIDTRLKPEEISQQIDLAEKYGVTLLVQFESAKDCEPDKVRAVVTRHKGRVKYWEVVNEPNFTLSPEKYVALLKETYAIIKEIDPAAQVLAPAVCGVQLPWHQKFYELGGKNYFDILSVHDYEGNESIDPGHWVWKFGELRKLMAANGDAGKAIWQTERAIGGVRGNIFLGGVQAVRVTLQRDVIEMLGIPNEHNMHYYLNQGGYSDVPTYLWSAAGPHPGALACRTREAMTRGHKFAGAVDFGPTGNKLFMGLRYEGPESSVLVLRNLGMLSLPLQLVVEGTDALAVTDSFGNETKAAVRGGRAEINASILPMYLRVPKTVKITTPKLDWGFNVAAQAKFSYSAETKSDFGLLNNGQFEVTHAGNPMNKYWTGELPTFPQTLEITLDKAQPIERLVLYTVRADNPHCTLLDYDVQYAKGNEWLPLVAQRTFLPTSSLARSPDSGINTWYLDQNFHVHQFKPVTADRLRVVALRTTFGFVPDAEAEKVWGGKMGNRLQLREIEIYGPAAGK